jgi:hypothetical protein
MLVTVDYVDNFRRSAVLHYSRITRAAASFDGLSIKERTEAVREVKKATAPFESSGVVG